MEHVVIIGNGISGVTAARHIRKHSNKQITMVSAETDYFFSRTALMYIYMGHMTYEHTKPYEDWFWKKNNIALKKGYVKTVATNTKTLYFKEGDTLKYDTLVIATGSKPNKFGWKGENLKGVQGLYSKQDLDTLEQNAPNNNVCKRAVIVGGGLIGIELAEMLISRKIPVTFLVREPSFWSGVLPRGESEMLNRHIKNHAIDLRLSSNLKAIKANNTGRVASIIIEETGEEIACDLVGLTAGVSPNIAFLKGSGIETDKGVLVNRHLETNMPGVYAIGDCAQQREAIGQRKTIEAVWYTGRMMGEVLAQTICGNPMPYNPGHWFNSAKFLDIEYQTYGWVSADKNKSDYEKQFHWKHQNDSKCITIAYHKDSKTFLGINTFGIRMRHAFFDTALTQNWRVEKVMAHLAAANFDPEFYRRHEKEIVTAFNNQTGSAIKLNKKGWRTIFAKSETI